MLKKISLKFKLTFLFVIIFTTLLGGFSFFLLREFSRLQLEEFDTNLYNYAVDIGESLDIDRRGGIEFDPQIINLNEKILPFALKSSFISVQNELGDTLAKTENTPLDFNHPINNNRFSSVLVKGATFKINFFNGLPYRVIFYLLPVIQRDSPLILKVGVPMSSYYLVEKNLQQFFVLSVVLIISISVVVGFFFVWRSLLPIRSIILKTKEIDFDKLTERVPVPSAQDEIFELAETINSLLSKIEKAWSAEERFIQDASHQLKTPLAIMKGELETLKNLPDVNSQKIVNSLHQEVSLLIRLTNDLLLLARMDSGVNSIQEKLNIEDIIVNQVGRLVKSYTAKNITVNFNFDGLSDFDSRRFAVFGDNELCGVMFYNLIENAIKYSPTNSIVEIIGRNQDEKLYFQIIDAGPGIPLGQEEKIFDRFYRSHTILADISGSGLGLAICKTVANHLGGKLSAKNNQRSGVGAIFTFEVVTKIC